MNPGLICALGWLLSFQAAGQAPAKDYNLLLITVDSLRPDHLGAYGYARKISPHLDHLAEEGGVFLRAYAQSNWTSPALLSLSTSMYPPAHGVETRMIGII